MHPLSGFAAHEKRINDASASPTARCDVPQAIALSLKHQVHRTNMHTEQLLALEGTNDSDDEHRKTDLTNGSFAQGHNQHSRCTRRITNLSAAHELAVDAPPELVCMLGKRDATDRRFARRLKTRIESAHDTSPVLKNTKGAHP